jgi:hypothetical protein
MGSPLTPLRILGGAVLRGLLGPRIHPSPEALAPHQIPTPPKSFGVVDKSAIEYIVSYGMFAPSTANLQPWHFHFSDGVLTLRHDPARGFQMLDLLDMASWVSFGAVLDNIELTAHTIGLEPLVTPFPDDHDPNLVARITFTPRSPQRHALFDWIPKRAVNRRIPDRRAPLDPDLARSLRSIAESCGARVQIRDDLPSLVAYEELLCAETRIGYVNAATFAEFSRTFRWTREDVESKRDGLDVWALEVRGPKRSILQALTQRENVEALRASGHASIFEKPALGRITKSSALALVTIPKLTPACVLEGGKAVNRLWLTVNAAGLGLQPHTALPYYMMRSTRIM